MKKLNLIKNYFRHLFYAKNEHSLHSPFVFDFYLKAIKKARKPEGTKSIEQLRTQFLKDQTLIEVTDFGAGSKVHKTNKRTIRSIAKNSISDSRKCKHLYHIANYMKCGNILELGSSLGIASRYLALPESVQHVIAIEGCPNIAKCASKHLKNSPFKEKVEIINSSIEQYLESLSEIKETRFDMVFFDGNHTYEATLDYFNRCKAFASEQTVFIFDDIFWSEGMQKAWNEICNDGSVMISIELFDLGVVFFRTNQPKQHFILRG